MMFAKTERFLDEMISSQKTAGCCAAVYVGGVSRFRRFAGYVDAEKKTGLGENSVFRLASMTKPVTAAAVLLCVQDGLMNLDDAVSKFLPSYNGMYVARRTEGGFKRGERARTITVRQLLTHTSGIGCGMTGDAQYADMKPREGDDLSTATERYSCSLLEFQPGSAQAYSPVMAMDVAARIVEIVSGTSYGEFLRSRIFLPLGMSASYDFKNFSQQDRVITYSERDGVLFPEDSNHNFDTFPAGYTGGGAGLLCTLGDYCIFAEMLRKCHSGEAGLLSNAAARELAKPQLNAGMEGIYDFFNWGLGVRTVSIQTDFQPLTAGSFGWSGAYGTHFWVDPARGVTAVYMHNSATYGGAGAPHTLAFERAVMSDLEVI